MKVLRETVHIRSSSSIHIDYNQPLVGGLSVRSTPARQIYNLQLVGGSTSFVTVSLVCEVSGCRLSVHGARSVLYSSR
eukprot:990387-Prymnesium_polylepis.1